MATKEKQQKKKKGRSVQDLIGVKTFTKYGLATNKGELLFYLVAPTNISVLSHVNIEIKIRHLMMVLSAVPDIEITCTDSSECFDDNKSYLQERLSEEHNPKVRKIIKKDIDFLDHIQMEMATARQFLFIARLKNTKDKQIYARLWVQNRAVTVLLLFCKIIRGINTAPQQLWQLSQVNSINRIYRLMSYSKRTA